MLKRYIQLKKNLHKLTQVTSFKIKHSKWIDSNITSLLKGIEIHLSIHKVVIKKYNVCHLLQGYKDQSIQLLMII